MIKRIGWGIEPLQREGGIRTVFEDRPDDLFLVCASYEPRSTTVTETLAKDYRAKLGIIYCNKEFFENRSKSQFEANFEVLKAGFQQHCDEVLEVIGSWLDPKVQFLAVREALQPNEKSSRLSARAASIDITTFNREALLTTLVLLRDNYPNAEVRSLYVTPKEHGEWLSRGFREVRSVIGFPGILNPISPTLLVVLSGFEPERTVKTIEEYEPTKVLLGIGDPSTKSVFLERNVEEQKLVLSRQEVEEFKFPVDNMKECQDILLDLLIPYVGSHNIILAPMSTKPSTVACLLVAEGHPEIQVAYCVPGEYNIDDYSWGAEEIIIDEIPHYGKSEGQPNS